MPGAQSHWSHGKDEPIRPELVVEVACEHMQSGRFRQMAHFHRWRPDKPPTACTFAELEVMPPKALADIFSGSPPQSPRKPG